MLSDFPFASMTSVDSIYTNSDDTTSNGLLCIAMVYIVLVANPNFSAWFIIKRTIKRKRENETQKVCNIMKGWDLKGVAKKNRKGYFP